MLYLKSDLRTGNFFDVLKTALESEFTPHPWINQENYEQWIFSKENYTFDFSRQLKLILINVIVFRVILSKSNPTFAPILLAIPTISMRTQLEFLIKH